MSLSPLERSVMSLYSPRLLHALWVDFGGCLEQRDQFGIADMEGLLENLNPEHL